MPYQFTTTLETVNPDIAVNELVQDTSLQSLAKTVSTALPDIAETVNDKNQSESVGNFNADLATLQQNIDDLAAESDLQRLEAVRRRNELLRDQDSSNDQLALDTFARKMEDITLMEQQQGIPMEARKRALVRQWSVIRPDLQGEFQKTLAINKALNELDKTSPKVDKIFEKVSAQQQEAYQTGSTVEWVQRKDMTISRAAEAEARLKMLESAGKATADDFQLYWTEISKAHLTAAQQALFEGERAARVGSASGVVAAKQKLLVLQENLLHQLEMERMKWNNTKGLLVDTSRIEAYIKNTVGVWTDALSTGDARDVAAVADMAKNDQADALLAKYLAREYPYLGEIVESPRVAGRLIGVIVDNAVKTFKGGSVFDSWSKQQGFAQWANLARQYNPQARMELAAVSVHLPWFREQLYNPNVPLSPATREMMKIGLDTLATGRVPDQRLSAEMAPVLTQLLSAVEKDTRLSTEEKAAVNGAQADLGWKSWGGWNSIFRPMDILKPDSVNVEKIRQQPSVEYKASWDKYVETPLTEDFWKLEPLAQAAIQFNPENTTAPFSVMWPTGTVVHGSRKFSDAQTYAQQLNEAFQARVNTRYNGLASAMEWAQDFYQNTRSFIPQTQPEEEGVIDLTTKMEEITVEAPRQ